MTRNDRPNPPQVIKVKFFEANGKKKLDKQSADAIESCAFGSAVYVVAEKIIGIQYVGCSTSGFGARFIKGVRDGLRNASKSFDEKGTNKGYRWPAVFDSVDVYVWETPDGDDLFAEAIEIDIAMLVRASTGFWPVELRRLSPSHHLCSSSSLMLSAGWAHLIYKWLITNGVQSLDKKWKTLANNLHKLDSERLGCC